MAEAHATAAERFAERLIAWQAAAGRHTLPWQQTRDPYRIWVSEIMLQQTQVATVQAYYARFMARFPDVQALAQAPLEAVLGLWSGLGYYRRAQLLHACAQALVREHDGVFPHDALLLAKLPGIGRSTAAAIAAFAWGHRAAILDGNVKRVLCRVFGIEGWPGTRAVEQRLWHRAQAELPAAQGEPMRAYTQGLMDLGALVCTRTRPTCMKCPMADHCVAQARQRQAELPAARPPRIVPERHAVWALLCEADAAVVLERRPARGIWGGLWSLPELYPPAPEAPVPGMVSQHQDALLTRLGRNALSEHPHGALRHVFTHFSLQARIVRLQLAPADTLAPGYLRLLPSQLGEAPLPRPVKTILQAWWGTVA